MLPWPFLCFSCLIIAAGNLIRSPCYPGFILQASLPMQAQHALLMSSIILFSYSVLLFFVCLIGYFKDLIHFLHDMNTSPRFLISLSIKVNQNYWYLRRRIGTWEGASTSILQVNASFFQKYHTWQLCLQELFNRRRLFWYEVPVCLVGGDFPGKSGEKLFVSSCFLSSALLQEGALLVVSRRAPSHHHWFCFLCVNFGL